MRMKNSGRVGAACKTLVVAQRLRLSGMHWGHHGAQAILTMRGWDQSDRFDEAWALVATTYERDTVRSESRLRPRPTERCLNHRA